MGLGKKDALRRRPIIRFLPCQTKHHLTGRWRGEVAASPVPALEQAAQCVTVRATLLPDKPKRSRGTPVLHFFGYWFFGDGLATFENLRRRR